MFIDDRSQLRAAITYVHRHPQKEGLAAPGLELRSRDEPVLTKKMANSAPATLGWSDERRDAPLFYNADTVNSGTSPAGEGAAGMAKLNVLPLASLWNQIRPPWASTISLEMASPRPAPAGPSLRGTR